MTIALKQILKTLWFASITVLFLFSMKLYAHPEDDFCEQGLTDMQLCAQLAELDRAQVGSAELPVIQLDRSPLDTLLVYIRLGAEHIVPLGLDHLAFVLALVLSATTLRSLLVQISVFTLAHSLTLALGVLNIVVLNSLWVELAIALSIAFVAIENLFFKYRLAWRSVVIFCFGLLHGLGFAGALSELGIPNGHFLSALIGFNLGVEIGQISFGLVFFLLFHKLIKERYFKRFVFIPGNCLIALAGIYWLVERLL